VQELKSSTIGSESIVGGGGGEKDDDFMPNLQETSLRKLATLANNNTRGCIILYQRNLGYHNKE
jgi:hypothetical protein